MSLLVVLTLFSDDKSTKIIEEECYLQIYNGNHKVRGIASRQEERGVEDSKEDIYSFSCSNYRHKLASPSSLCSGPAQCQSYNPHLS